METKESEARTIVYLNPKDLKPHPRNKELFDDISSGKWVAFLESIMTDGIYEPITITRDNLIISGHQRARAGVELGLDTVPCCYADFEESNEMSREDQILKQLIETNLLQRGIGNTNNIKMGICWDEYLRLSGIRRGRANSKGTIIGEVQNAADAKSREDIAKDLFHKDVSTLDRWRSKAAFLSYLDPFLRSLFNDNLIDEAISKALAERPIEEQEALLQSLQEMNVRDYGKYGIDNYDEDEDDSDTGDDAEKLNERAERLELATNLRHWYKENLARDKASKKEQARREYAEKTGLSYGYMKCDKCGEVKLDDMFPDDKTICKDCLKAEKAKRQAKKEAREDAEMEAINKSRQIVAYDSLQVTSATDRGGIKGIQLVASPNMPAPDSDETDETPAPDYARYEDVIDYLMRGIGAAPSYDELKKIGLAVSALDAIIARATALRALYAEPVPAEASVDKTEPPPNAAHVETHDIKAKGEAFKAKGAKVEPKSNKAKAAEASAAVAAMQARKAGKV